MSVYGHGGGLVRLMVEQAGVGASTDSFLEWAGVVGWAEDAALGTMSSMTLHLNLNLRVVGTRVMCYCHRYMCSPTSVEDSGLGWRWGSMLVGTGPWVVEGSILVVAAGTAQQLALWGKEGLTVSGPSADGAVVEVESLGADALNGLSRRKTW